MTTLFLNVIVLCLFPVDFLVMAALVVSLLLDDVRTFFFTAVAGVLPEIQ